MTTINEVIEVCQRVNNAVSGVRLCPAKMRDYLPGEIAAANLPYAITLPGQATNTYRTMGGKYVRERRRYTVRVLVAPRESGIRSEKPHDAVILLDGLLTKWLDTTNEAMNTANVEVVYEDDSITDTGYIDIDHGGKLYHGFEINLTIDRIAIR